MFEKIVGNAVIFTKKNVKNLTFYQFYFFILQIFIISVIIKLS